MPLNIPNGFVSSDTTAKVFTYDFLPTPPGTAFHTPTTPYFHQRSYYVKGPAIQLFADEKQAFHNALRLWEDVIDVEFKFQDPGAPTFPFIPLSATNPSNYGDIMGPFQNYGDRITVTVTETMGSQETMRLSPLPAQIRVEVKIRL